MSQEHDAPATDVEGENRYLRQKLEASTQRVIKLQQNLNDTLNTPWYFIKARQQRLQKKYKRLGRYGSRYALDFSNGANPVSFEVAAGRAAVMRRKHSDAFRKRVRRTSLQLLIAAGGVHAYRERTVTDHSGRFVPGIDWAGREPANLPENLSENQYQSKADYVGEQLALSSSQDDMKANEDNRKLARQTTMLSGLPTPSPSHPSPHRTRVRDAVIPEDDSDDDIIEMDDASVISNTASSRGNYDEDKCTHYIGRGSSRVEMLCDLIAEEIDELGMSLHLDDGVCKALIAGVHEKLQQDDCAIETQPDQNIPDGEVEYLGDSSPFQEEFGPDFEVKAMKVYKYITPSCVTRPLLCHPYPSDDEANDAESPVPADVEENPVESEAELPDVLDSLMEAALRISQWDAASTRAEALYREEFGPLWKEKTIACFQKLQTPPPAPAVELKENIKKRKRRTRRLSQEPPVVLPGRSITRSSALLSGCQGNTPPSRSGSGNTAHGAEVKREEEDDEEEDVEDEDVEEVEDLANPTTWKRPARIPTWSPGSKQPTTATGTGCGKPCGAATVTASWRSGTRICTEMSWRLNRAKGGQSIVTMKAVPR
ncbi:hypothetical protein BX600DRAFT_441331 [Xylariales sp. PMI_506]|nr:hypothetical protein BX600DRAFT_441331 [Xylariales sp. PMI_506]